VVEVDLGGPGVMTSRTGQICQQKSCCSISGARNLKLKGQSGARARAQKATVFLCGPNVDLI